LQGNDLYHPRKISQELAELAPNSTFIELWKEGEHIESAKVAVAAFLAQNSPA
jgi:hypothetical protein